MSVDFALIRLPNTSTYYLLQGDFSSSLKKINPSNHQPEFVFSPFNCGDKAYILNPTKMDFFKNLTDVHVKLHLKATESFHASKEEYTAKVQSAVNQFTTDSQFQKVVLARTKTVHTSIQELAVFQRLCENYPTSFIYLTSSSVFGSWMGASPELLLNQKSHSINTVALAGTAPIKATNWGQKEIDEQLWVCRYIEDILSQEKVSFTKSMTHDLIMGNIKHLVTDYQVRVNSSQPVEFSKLLLSLNPTPAVAGIPKAAAIDFILQNENLNRRFYTGFYGVTSFFGSNHLQVNLRCLEITQTGAVIYAGAGITKDSDPSKEWEETARKIALMESLL